MVAVNKEWIPSGGLMMITWREDLPPKKYILVTAIDRAYIARTTTGELVFRDGKPALLMLEEGAVHIDDIYDMTGAFRVSRATKQKWPGAATL